MKPIETPVFRPTADCIWNTFRSSGKRHLILTGGRKSGKTTLLSELVRKALPGITTWAEPRKAVYLKENATGETVQIGAYDDTLPGTENKMRLCRDGFGFAVSVLRRCAETDGERISIDEIGYLDAQCPEYCDAIRDLMNVKRVIAVVRKQEIPFLEEIRGRRDALLVDLDRPFGNLGCVIMASGMGKRFGGNKLMADFNGKPLIQWALDATEGIFARRVVVTRHRDVEALCVRQGVDVVCHDLPYRSDTVRLGLQAVGEVNGCMFCPGDQPLLRRESVASLALSAVNVPDDIWRVAHEGTVGAPMLFPKWTFEQLLSLPEGKGGGVVAKKYPERVRTIPVQDKNELRDVDCPEDLKELAGTEK